LRNRLFIVIGLTAAIGLTVATSAFALGVTGTVTGTAGIGLGLPSAPTFAATLTGDDQTVTYAPALGVTDARGTGAGWHLSASATPLTDGSAHTLGQQVTAVAQACHAGSTCTVPASSLGLPVTVGTTASNIYSAAANFGLGKIDVTPTVTVAIPGNAFAGSYTSTITFSATTGP
jgi:hypothetical protein